MALVLRNEGGKDIMSDNDLAIEMGLIDYQGNILVDDESDEDVYQSTKDDFKSIKVSLTPIKYLDSESQYMRSRLTNNQLIVSDINLEIMYDKYNKNDDFALQVFCNRVPIGYIQKYDSNIDIDGFCFVENEKVHDLTLEWNDNELLLSRVLTYLERDKIEKAVKNGQRLKEESIAEEKLRELERKRIKEEEQRIKHEDKLNEMYRLEKKYATLPRKHNDYTYLEQSIGLPESYYEDYKIEEFIDNTTDSIKSFFQPIIDFFSMVLALGVILFILFYICFILYLVLFKPLF